MMNILKPGETSYGKKKFEPYITISDRHIYFSAAACRKFNLQEFDHLYFVNDGHWWGFHKTTNTDGYVLTSKGKASLSLGHRTLIKMMQKNLRLEGPESFAVRGSTRELHGEVLYDIITSKKL